MSSGTEITTEPLSSYTSTDTTSSLGTANLIAASTGSTIDLSLSSSGGFNLIGGAGSDNFKGSSGKDTFTIINSQFYCQ